jgi:DNA-binding transcriptional LysR family regulator
MLFRTVADMESRLKQVQTQIIESTDRPKGPLRITAPSEIGTIWLTSIMREFTTLYPEIEVTLMADDREYDLSKGEADVAIRLYDTTHPDMIQKQLVSLHNSVYASNAYLRENGIPRDLRDLKKHRLILYSEKSQQPFKKVNWLDGMIEKDRKPKSIFKINSIFGMLKAVESDLGVAALPDYMVLHNRNISKILHEVHGPQVDAYIIYPVELRKSKRVKVFRNFVLQKMRDVAF